jgi:dTDP-4-dehydrorhamnose 3,5-epimerase
MQIQPLAIPDVLLISPKKFGDHRGFFMETYSKQKLKDLAQVDLDFVQDNHSLSGPVGTVRALHYQLPPMAQAKLVRVIRGKVLDVALDIRRSSPTFGQHVSAILSAENGQQMFVPVGFAHGFVTLEPDTEFVYKVSNYYSPQHERGIIWNDPDLKIDWQIDPAKAILSDKDTKHPPLKLATELYS